MRESKAFLFIERRHEGIEDAPATDEARQRQADIIKGAAAGDSKDGVAVVDDGVAIPMP